VLDVIRVYRRTSHVIRLSSNLYLSDTFLIFCYWPSRISRSSTFSFASPARLPRQINHATHPLVSQSRHSLPSADRNIHRHGAYGSHLCNPPIEYPLDLKPVDSYSRSHRFRLHGQQRLLHAWCPDVCYFSTLAAMWMNMPTSLPHTRHADPTSNLSTVTGILMSAVKSLLSPWALASSAPRIKRPESSKLVTWCTSRPGKRTGMGARAQRVWLTLPYPSAVRLHSYAMNWAQRERTC